MMKKALRFALPVAVVAAAIPFATYVAGSAEAGVDGAAPTPPMGWNSYNNFGGYITDSIVRGVTDAMASNGMRAAGYTYVNIDEGWQSGRDAQGAIQPDYARFPNGIKSVADYVHSKGLKFGIYTTPTATTCGGRTGTGNNVTTDVNKFASWGVDYIKLDWCGADYSSTGAATIATRWRDAINATGRTMVLSINAGASSSVAPWASRTVTAWRSGDDICASWKNKTGAHNPATRDCFNTQYHNGIYDYIYSNITDNAPYVGPGHYADADMLEVGNPGLSFEEAKTHFSLWAMWSSPLIAGNDPRNMNGTDDASRILLNSDVIAVNQDRTVSMGRRIADNGGRQVWSKTLANGGRAVALINASDSAATISTTASALGLPAASSYAVRDLWAHTSSNSAGTISASVPAHGTAMFTVSGGAGNPPPSTGTPPPSSSTSALRGQGSGRCLDVNGASQANGATVTIWDCYGTANQQWTATSGGELRVYGNKCLDVSNNGTANGTAVTIWDCNGGANQRFRLNADNTITAAAANRCLDVNGAGTANGTKVQIWDCYGSSNQKWTKG